MNAGGAQRVVSILLNAFAKRGYKLGIATNLKEKIEFDFPENISFFNIAVDSNSFFLRKLELIRNVSSATINFRYCNPILII